MNPEQIKDEIRKLNWIDKIGIYRWINQEVAGDRGIGTDRSRQIRQDMERIAGFPVQEGVSLSAESKIHRTTRLSYHPKIFVVIK